MTGHLEKWLWHRRPKEFIFCRFIRTESLDNVFSKRTEGESCRSRSWNQNELYVTYNFTIHLSTVDNCTGKRAYSQQATAMTLALTLERNWFQLHHSHQLSPSTRASDPEASTLMLGVNTALYLPRSVWFLRRLFTSVNQYVMRPLGGGVRLHLN